MENYEQKYKQALCWMQSLYNGLHGKTKEEAEHFFPELKESEDERIRNFLIDFIKVCGWTEKKDQGWPLREECIAWLEKQGEKSPTWSEEDEKFVVDTVDFLCDAKSLYLLRNERIIRIRECIDWLKLFKERMKGE